MVFQSYFLCPPPYTGWSSAVLLTPVSYFRVDLESSEEAGRQTPREQSVPKGGRGKVLCCSNGSKKQWLASVVATCHDAHPLPAFQVAREATKVANLKVRREGALLP